MRAAHGLPLAQLESNIPLFAVTYFFWSEKPKDIRTPSIVDTTYASGSEAYLRVDGLQQQI